MAPSADACQLPRTWLFGTQVELEALQEVVAGLSEACSAASAAHTALQHQVCHIVHEPSRQHLRLVVSNITSWQHPAEETHPTVAFLQQAVGHAHALHGGQGCVMPHHPAGFYMGVGHTATAASASICPQHLQYPPAALHSTLPPAPVQRFVLQPDAPVRFVSNTVLPRGQSIYATTPQM
jgi:hypothetical protein